MTKGPLTPPIVLYRIRGCIVIILGSDSWSFAMLPDLSAFRADSDVEDIRECLEETEQPESFTPSDLTMCYAARLPLDRADSSFL
jgi:hypothetical protein